MIVVACSRSQGGLGQVSSRKTRTQMLKTVSIAIRLKKYAPSQYPCSPRSRPRPQTGQLGTRCDQVTKIGPPPQCGQRRRKALPKSDVTRRRGGRSGEAEG